MATAIRSQITERPEKPNTVNQACASPRTKNIDRSSVEMRHLLISLSYEDITRLNIVDKSPQFNLTSEDNHYVNSHFPTLTLTKTN